VIERFPSGPQRGLGQYAPRQSTKGARDGVRGGIDSKRMDKQRVSSRRRPAIARRDPRAGAARPMVRGETAMRLRHPFDYDAFAAAFVEQGYEGASMERIAERARVAKRTLYYHFRSKEELFDATVAVICDDAIAHLFAEYDRADALPPPLNIKAQLDAFFTYAAAHPERRALLFDTKAATSASIAKIGKTTDKITERIAQGLRKRGAVKGRPTTRVPAILAAMTVGAADHVLRQLSRSSDWDVEAVLSLMTELWWHAFKNVSLEALSGADRPMPRKQRT
jgi:AcrR family transcriptional regulator